MDSGGSSWALPPHSTIDRRLLPGEMAALYAFLREDGLQAAPGKEAKADSSPPPETAVAVREPIHSGQCVEIEESFIVPGELHPGVWIQAGRDVIVMGSARGRGTRERE